MFEDPKFWLLISFIVFVILMYKPFNTMLIGGLDTKIEEIKKNINESLQSFTEAELKLKEAEKKTADLDKKINELLN
jgi:F0F1-type ATP synthase membrane subunit b/b'